MKIHDFSNCPYSPRNGFYGGAAGDKDGILIDGEPWICKYPKPTVGMRGMANLAPYASTPLSEYLGSHIYQILGYPVHETILGIRDGLLVVACKDFCAEDERLFEIRTLKNIHIKEMREELGLDLHETGDDHLVSLGELFIHFEHNPEMKSIEGLQARFWDQVVIDGLLGNNDRNNGNWGIIVGPKGRRIAPIFDNGASFYPKKSEESVRKALAIDESGRTPNSLNVITPFTLDGEHHVNFARMLELTGSEIPSGQATLLQEAIHKNAHLVEEHLEEIKTLFDGLPEEWGGIEVLSKERKAYYLRSFMERFKLLLLPKSSQ